MYIFQMNKMKIGIQILAYNCEETIDDVINPWLILKENYEVKIWVASGQFKIYKDLGYENKNQKTLEKLNQKIKIGDIDFLFVPDENNLLSDHETRHQSISYFVENDIDLMIQVDSDEFYTKEEVLNFINFIESNPKYTIYNTVFRNIVGDNNGYVDFIRFSAGKIKRYGGIGEYYLDAHWSFYGENNPDKKMGVPQNIEYRWVESVNIPKELVNPIHDSWSTNRRGSYSSDIKGKIEYQNRYYETGSSFVWDEYSNSVRNKNSNSKINIVFSTSNRFNAFKKTLDSLMKYNPNISHYTNKVYVLDDKSKWEERKEMERILMKHFNPLKITTLTFNGVNDWDWTEKLNFIKHLNEGSDYLLFLEDDWESICSLDIEQHLSFLDHNQNVDLITFSEWWHLQNDMDIDDYSVDDTYWVNPYPKSFKHTHKVENGLYHWHIVTVPNFSFNPSLVRNNVFLGEFSDIKASEYEYGLKHNFIQFFTKNAKFKHIGDDISIITPLREKIKS